MAKEIRIKVSKAVLVKTETSDNPLNMMTSAPGPEEVHGRGDISLEVHGLAFTNAPDEVHGRSITEVHGEGPQILEVHGRIQVPIPQGQTVSRIEIERGEDGDLTIIVHE